MSGGTTSNAAEFLALTQRNARIARGRPTAFRRVPEQLLNHRGDGIAHRVLDEPFQAARREARAAGRPEPSVEQFLARTDPDSPVGRLVDELLGSAQARLLRTADPGEMAGAIRDHYRHFRNAPPPYDAGISYARHHYLDGAHVDLRGHLRVVPANAPAWTREGVPLYPGWDVGRSRANRSVAAVQLSRSLRRDVPLDRGGKALLEALSLEPGIRPLHCYLDPEIRLTRTQWAYTLDSGNSPIYRSVLTTGARPPGKGLRAAAARSAGQARWELAVRLGDPDLVDDATDLRRAWDAARTPDAATRPRDFAPHDAFSQASTDELFAIALREPGAPQVYLATVEWEHHRSQRLAGRIEGLAAAMAVGDEWRSRFRMLTGLCEPENLHLLTPWMHAMEDFYAGGFAPVRNLIWKDGTFNRAAFLVNTARVDRWGNEAVVAGLATHRDAARAIDALVAYEPRDLIALLSAMREDEVLSAARGLTGNARQSWNALAGQLNNAAGVLGLPGAYRLPSLS